MASFLDRQGHLDRALKYLKNQGINSEDDVSEPNYTSGKIPGTNQIIKNDMAGVKSNFGQSIQPASDLDNEVVGGKTAFDYTGEGGPEGGGKFKSFLGKFFKDRTEQMEPDEYGLTPPTQEKPSIFKTILKVGVPALMGMAGGAGLLPGALAGLTGMEGHKEGKYRMDTKDYQNARNAKESMLFKKMLMGQNEGQFRDKLEFEREKEQWDREHPTTAKQTASEEYQSLLEEAARQKRLTGKISPELKARIEFIEKKNKLDE